VKYVLVDSSIWIEFFKKGAHQQTIIDLINKGLLATCGLIKAELIPFFKTSQIKEVQHYLNLATHLTFEDNDWIPLIEYRRSLISKGEHNSISDLIIMITAKLNNAQILTLDGDFRRAQKIINFEFYPNNSYE
jgi:predicted nucleic acid-binding protein